MKKIISLFLVFAITLCIFAGCKRQKTDSTDDSTANSSEQTSENLDESANTSDNTEESATSESTGETLNTEESISSESTGETTDSGNNESDKPSKDSADANGLFPGYQYDTTLNIEDNVFIDALAYTGYNIEKHRADGLMWQYILSADKRHRGWLSNITYGGGSTGLETKDGLPDIKAMEWGGLVCASFASYVYFNYLPNVAKIDTSSLAIPEKTWLAPYFQEACEKWLADGLTYKIDFTAENVPDKIVFNPAEEIPMGSIILFRDIYAPERKSADHVTIYIGEKNGYHWVIQTGNKNGPEFCAVERFKFGPDPMWPLAIYATPTCIYNAITAPT